MSIELNDIIDHAKDKRKSPEFLAGILGLRAGPAWAHFVPVVMSNGVTLGGDAPRFDTDKPQG